MIPVFGTGHDELSALPPAKSQRFMDHSLATPGWENRVTLRSVEHLAEFEAAGWAPHVGPRPLLMIVGAADDCTFPEIELDVFATAREPKKLVVHPGGHFQTYTEHFEQTSSAARDWFSEHLVS